MMSYLPSVDALRSKADTIRETVHGLILPLRDDIFKVNNYTTLRPSFGHWKKRHSHIMISIPDPDPFLNAAPPAMQGGANLMDKIVRLEARAAWYEHEARESEKVVNESKLADPGTLLRITARAGVMLAWTEDISVSCDTLTDAAASQNVTPPAPIVRSQAVTVVATARDHVGFAKGQLENLKDMLASRTRFWLGVLLLASVAPYLLFHPADPMQVPRVPASFRPEWEILFWSLFGAVTISIVYTAEDVAKPEFDIRTVEKWRYRVLVAAPTAFGYLLLLDAIGFAPGGKPLVDFANPDYPTLASLAFVAGISGRSTLEAIGNAWRKFIGTDKIST